MAAKQLVYSDTARQKLLAGVSKLARAVRCTLGPRGRNVVLDKGWGSPNVTKDGVTVAEEIELQDPYENMGAQLVKEAASKTSAEAGDGTTTATVLAEAVYREGLKAIAAGADPMALTRGIQKAVNEVVDELKRLAEKINPNDEKEITEVATIAANNNKEIGAKLAQAMKLVGAADGVIIIEEGKTAETEIVVVQGMRLDRGFLSPHFVTNQETVTVELYNPHVLIYEEKISSAKSLIPLLETISKKKEPLLIIAEDIEGDALATLVVNKLKGILQVCAVKAPGYGDRRKALLGDIATLTGGRAIFKDLGIQLENIQLHDLGRARHVHIDAENTTITEGAGDRRAIEGRIAMIRREIETTDSEYDREKLQERLARLAGGVARVKVGAATETEMKERKALYEDALHATRAALAEGIVPGGGVALVQARKILDKLKLGGDQALGVRTLQTALDMPARMIAENAGLDGAVVVANIRRSKNKNYGYDADKGEFTDLRKQGIVDPVKVTRSALQNGASVACLLLTTESMVADISEKVKEQDYSEYASQGHGRMGGMAGMMSEVEAAQTVSETVNSVTESPEPPPPNEPPERPPRPPQNGEPRRRFLQARFPQHVLLKDRVFCLVRVALQSGGQDSTAIILDVPPEGTEVLFVLHTPGFLAHSDVHQTVFVPADADSRWVAFEVEAQQIGVHTLEVTAFHKGAYLGMVSLQVTVDSADRTGPATDHLAPFTARMLEPGEVTLLIRYSQAEHVYRYQMFDGRVGARDEISSGQLLRTPQEAVEQMVSEMNELARGGSAFTAEQTREFLKGRGIALWREFIPEALQTLFWECRDDIRRLIILSAGDPVPWEVFYPFKPGGFDAGFLAEQFPVARWRFGPPPLGRLRVSQADFVCPGGSLQAAEEEITAVRGLFDGRHIPVHPSIRDLAELLRLFNDAHFNLLHFACHNAFRADAPDASKIMMGAVPFQPLFLNQHLERFRPSAPLVFMNACRTGGEAPLYTRLAGWAQSFLAAGAGAFVGSLWEVRDGTARRFAEQFYDTLLSGQNLGQSLNAARAAVRDSAGDPTWLAYTLYGDPAATVTWEG